MKILFLIGYLSFSGAENVLKAVAYSLLKLDCDVCISIRVDSEERNYCGIPIYPCTGNPVQRLKKVIKIIKDNNIDIVVAFGFPFNLDAAVIKVLTGEKIVLCERHDPSSVKRRFSQKLEKKLLYPIADGFVVQTNKTKRYYLSHYTKQEQKVCVIPNPVRYAKPECVANHQRAKEIVTVGRYDNKQKNHIMLIRAFCRFHNEHLDYLLKIYGEGSDRPAYEAEISKLQAERFVLLMGFEEKPIKKICNADIFCLTSNYEGMPNALIEAMSIGLPCISTRCGGGAAEELIVDGKNGILIDIDNEDALLSAMDRLAEDRYLNQHIANEAYAINETLSLENITKRWKQFLEAIISH